MKFCELAEHFSLLATRRAARSAACKTLCALPSYLTLCLSLSASSAGTGFRIVGTDGGRRRMEREEGKSVPSLAGGEPESTTTTSSNLQTTKSLAPPISLFLDQHQHHHQQEQQQQHLQPHFTSAQFLSLHQPSHVQHHLQQHQRQPHHPQQQPYSPSPFLNHHYNHLYPYRENRLPCFKHSSPGHNLMMDDRSGFGSGGGGGVGGGGGGGGNGCNGSVSGLNHAATSYRDWDSRWESGTVVTAATSVRSGGSLDMDLNFITTGKQGSKSSSENDPHSVEKISSFHLPCQMYASSIVDIIISVCAFLSPILMLILPKLDPERFRVSDVCGPELTTCDGILISFFFKILLLVLASLLLFFRSPRASLPRVFLSRAIILGLILFLTVAYWLFFMVQSSERRVADYDLPFRDLLLSYPVPLLECILWVHYLAVILIEIRHQRQEYYVKVVRSPDGHSRSYTIGQLSIQAAAVFVLDKYYSEFPIYNPHLDSLPFADTSSSARKKNKMTAGSTIEGPSSGLKFYDVDAVHPGMHTNTSTPNNNSQNTSSLIGNGHLPESNNHHQHQNSHSQFAPSASPRSARPTGMLGGGSNFHVSPLNGGSNSIYSIRSATGNNQHSTSAHVTSGKSHSVVGVERSSDRHHHHHNHHHSRRGGSSSRSSHRGGSSDRGKATSAIADHHKDRMHDESEFERRVKKRRARLVSSAEEAFTHVKLMGESDPSNGEFVWQHVIPLCTDTSASLPLFPSFPLFSHSIRHPHSYPLF